MLLGHDEVTLIEMGCLIERSGFIQMKIVKMEALFLSSMSSSLSSL